MLIYPAIDLIGGRCVRLKHGCFDDVTEYGEPFAQARAFAEAGATWVHVVDLDGARAGAPAQHELIGAIARESGLRVQSGGGVRERAHVEALLEAGVARVVVGSAAVKRPADVRAWVEALGAERVCCAFDVRAVANGYEAAVDGWAKGSGRMLGDVLAQYPEGALRHALVTDISRDGVLTGPNVALMAGLASQRPDVLIQASGGVATLEDLKALRATGAAGAIIGRALYERRFTLEDALAS